MEIDFKLVDWLEWLEEDQPLFSLLLREEDKYKQLQLHSFCLELEEVIALYKKLERELTNAGYFEKKKDDIKKDDSVGYVYFLKEVGGNKCKIGLTNDLDRRIGQISPKLPFQVELFHSIKTNCNYKLENFFHTMFKEKRLNGEWFELTESDLESVSVLDVAGKGDFGTIKNLIQ
ncbi:GIY-YIG nuclease family protein [Natroniella sulfidigena]|uniref:GIY-YIG nuclease family protein n=1 Tax=Natroniella sulfidigena TaxID=723921 RepID=UPI00200A7814|nr:GIY-YIG nuclease family protein [Natroniella sulfidigena]MCK8818109.1 GIY-YIG nuclease family protein [Natroniella sulfidigena]